MPAPEPSYAQRAQNCEDTLASLRGKLHELDLLEGDLRQATERAHALEEQAAQTVARLQRENGALKSDIASLREDNERLRRELGTAKENAGQMRASLADVNGRLRACRQELWESS